MVTAEEEASMSTFRKFDHVARSSHREVDGICDGTVHVFPKLDGTNGSVWAEQLSSVVGGGTFEVKVGSRNRVLSEGRDNHGFRSYVMDPLLETPTAIREFVITNPSLILYGEWLIPNSIKGYGDGAWRKFYVFDVYSRSRECYLEYDIYSNQLEEAGIDYIPAYVMENPQVRELGDLAATSVYLMKPGEFGEGIVVKNYAWRNFFGRQPWMKMLRPGFATKAKAPKGDVEVEIAEALVDGHLVEKEFAKGIGRLTNSMGVEFGQEDCHESAQAAFVEEHRSKVIGILLAQVFNDVIDDGLTARSLKKFGYPTVNFRTLRSAVTRRVKELKPELFS